MPLQSIPLRPVVRPRAATTHNRYCGPAALSALTGLSTGEAALLIRQCSGQRYVKSTGTWTMQQALSRVGYHAMPVWVAPSDRLNLRQFMARLGPIATKTALLVNVTHHYVVARGRRVVDNGQPTPVGLRQHGSRRRRVVAAWAVYRHDPRKRAVWRAAARRPDLRPGRPGVVRRVPSGPSSPWPTAPTIGVDTAPASV